MATSPFLENSGTNVVVDRLQLVEELLDLAERAQTHTRSAGSAIAIKRENALVIRTSTGTAPEVGASMVCGEGVVGTCVVKPYSGSPADAEMDAALRALGVRSVIAIPVQQERQLIGVLMVTSQSPDAFSRMHVAILMTMAGEVARVLSRLESIPTVSAPPAAPTRPALAETPKIPVPAVETKVQPQSIVASPLPIEQKPAPAMKLMIDKPVAPKITAPVQEQKTLPAVKQVIEKPITAKIPVTTAKQSTPAVIATPEKLPLSLIDKEVVKDPEPLADLLAPGEDPLKYGSVKTGKPRPKGHPTATFVYQAPIKQESRRSKAPLIGVAAVLVMVVTVGVWRQGKSSPSAPQVAAETPAPIPHMTAVPMPVSSVTVQASAPVQAAAVQAAPIVAIPQPKITHEAVVEQKAPEAVIAVKPALHIAAATPNHADSAVEAPTLNLAASAAMPEFAAPKAPAATLAVKKSTATPSEAIHTVAPAYPETARRNGITGNVRLQLTISAAGKVTNVKVLDGPVILQPAAVAAARQWVYRPAMLDGRPTESTSELVVKFAR